MKKLKKLIAAVLAAVLVLSAAMSLTDIEADAAATTVDLTIDVTYHQTEARSMLEMINEFRTGDDAWYWNSTDTEKTYVTLSELTYDYDLEEIAMQRAAEIAVLYSHTRTNGTSCFTIETEYGYYCVAVGENIAAGYTSAASVFAAWQEADEDYDGQGHRRNMLSSDYTRVGIACVEYQGYYYWVQEFAKPSSGSGSTTETTANDSSTTATVTLSADYITTLSSLTASDESVTLEYNSTCAAPSISVSMRLTGSIYHWPSSRAVTGTIETPDWSSADTSIASVSAGTISGNSVGSTTLSYTLLSVTATADVTVTGIPLGSAALSYSSVQYTGSALTPAVTVYDKYGSLLTEGTDYTVSYSDNTSLGTAAVTVTGTGNYSGTLTQTFTIFCDHTYDSGTVTTEPACEETGVRTYTCTICGTTRTETIAATGHTLTKTEQVDPTCTESGTEAYWSCSVCGKLFSDEDGTAEISAPVVIAALNHNYTSEVTKEATCTEDGVLTYTCLNDSSHTYTEVIEALGHDYVAEVTTEPTCTEEGVMTYTCSNDSSHTYTETIAALGHMEGEAVVENYVAPTCTEAGSYESVVYCTVCGEELSRETVTIEATDHNYVSAVTIEPTCTEAGVMTYTCSNDSSHTYTETIAALGHTEGEAMVENYVAPTCTEAGSYESVVYCTVCGEELSRETVTVSATGHTYEAGEFEWNNDCSAAALTFTCSVCGDVQVVEAQITTQTTEPTCTEAGSIVKTASVEFEGITYTDAQTTTLDMIDHTAVSADNAVEATCGTDGKEADTICAVCGEILEEGAVIPATGEHNYEGVVTKQATTTEEGEITYTCTVCGDTYTETIPVLEEETTTAPETTEETTTTPESTEETTTTPETTEETTTTPESTEETTTTPESTEETTTTPESTKETTTAPESTEETTTTPESTEETTTTPESTEETTTSPETTEETTTTPESTEETTTVPETTEDATTAQETETEADAADEETTEEAAADEDTSESPATGDSNSFAVWACMGMLAALALAFTAIRRRIE